MIALVILWRIDNPRVERMRAAIVDRVVPNMEWAMHGQGSWRASSTISRATRGSSNRTRNPARVAADARLGEAALQLEQERGLLDLNRVSSTPN